jgi:hypothetical protein
LEFFGGTHFQLILATSVFVAEYESPAQENVDEDGATIEDPCAVCGVHSGRLPCERIRASFSFVFCFGGDTIFEMM